jgi:hypothetical protein
MDIGVNGVALLIQRLDLKKENVCFVAVVDKVCGAHQKKVRSLLALAKMSWQTIGRLLSELSLIFLSPLPSFSFSSSSLHLTSCPCPLLTITVVVAIALSYLSASAYLLGIINNDQRSKIKSPSLTHRHSLGKRSATHHGLPRRK